MAASVGCLAKANGLSRIDHVVLSEDNGMARKGENLFVVQGGLRSRQLAELANRAALAGAPTFQTSTCLVFARNWWISASVRVSIM